MNRHEILSFNIIGPMGFYQEINIKLSTNLNLLHVDCNEKDKGDKWDCIIHFSMFNIKRT